MRKLVCVLSLVAISLCACSNAVIPPPDVQASSVETRIEHLLEEKYGDDMTVVSLEKTPGSMAFSSATYTASVESEKNAGFFTARFNEEEDLIRDDHPRLFWDEEIEALVQSALLSAPDISVQGSEIVYDLSDEVWTSHAALLDYLKMSHTYIDLTLTVPDCPIEEGAAQINALRHALLDEQLQYAMSCEYRGKSFVFSEKQDTAALTDEAVSNKMERGA